jgi:hypothetical protein
MNSSSTVDRILASRKQLITGRLITIGDERSSRSVSLVDGQQPLIQAGCQTVWLMDLHGRLAQNNAG